MRRFLPMLLLVVACQKTEPAATSEPAPAEAPPATTSGAPAQPQQIAEGLQTPESVLYDADQDVYFISNINGQPLAADGNGYIARVNAQTLQVEAKWIEGGRDGITLNAPKGMAILGDDLYVSDLNTVRKFDRKSGKSNGETMIGGATFLNDVASDGTSVYVSDTGMKAGAGGNFEPTGTDAIWKITAGTATRIAGGSELNRPNGIDVVNGEVWVTTFGAAELFKLANGKKSQVVTLPKGSLDGLVHLADGTFLVTSWDQKCVYRGPASGPFTAAIENINAPADIGLDTKRNRLLVPHFMDHVVSIHPLQ